MPAIPFTYSNLPAIGQANATAASNIISSFNYIGTFLTGANISSAMLDESALNAAVPIGTIAPFAGTTAPTLWKLCNGDSLDWNQYAALRQVLTPAGGTPAYGSVAGTSFKVPDLRGRFPVGVGTNADVDTLGEDDGVAVQSRTPRHTHTVPAHKHALTGNATASVSGPTTAIANQEVLRRATGSENNWTVQQASGVTEVTRVALDSAHSHTVTIGGTAGAAAAVDGDSAMTSGVQTVPFVTVNFIIKAGVA